METLKVTPSEFLNILRQKLDLGPPTVSWNIKKLEFIKKGSALGIAQIPREQGIQYQLIAPYGAKVIHLMEELNSQNDKCLIELEECKHGALFGNSLCIDCGTDLHDEDPKPPSRKQPMNLKEKVRYRPIAISAGDLLVYNREKERIIVKNYKRDLLQKEKLVLVLDIDHTLIHTTQCTFAEILKMKTQYNTHDTIPTSHLNGGEVQNEDPGNIQMHKNNTELQSLQMSKDVDEQKEITKVDEIKSPMIDSALEDMYYFSLEGDLCKYKVKLRPYLHNFLENLSKLYDMYLFTKGIRKYALEIHSIIDPEEKYIAKQKILSRENTPNHEAKQISKVIPHEESMVLIIDDRKDAWLNSYNVISCHPFKFFEGEEINNSYDLDNHPNLKADPNDKYLYYYELLATKIHTIYFELKKRCLFEPDVRRILEILKSNILDNQQIAFSRMFPADVDPLSNYEMNIAKSMGAKLFEESSQGNPDIVFALQYAKTPKMQQAEKLGMPILHISWLYYCEKLWLKVPQTLFLLTSHNPNFQPIDEAALYEEINQDRENYRSIDIEYYVQTFESIQRRHLQKRSFSEMNTEEIKINNI